MVDLVSRCRSYRRFDERVPVAETLLRDLVGLARMTPSAANRQPLRYVLSCAPDWNAKIFETLAWAAYLKDWPGPAPGERPTGYIVVLVDSTISQAADVDVGICAQTILLGVALAEILGVDDDPVLPVAEGVNLDLDLGIGIDGDVEDPPVPREPGIRPSPVVADADGSDAVDDAKRPVLWGRQASIKAHVF